MRATRTFPAEVASVPAARHYAREALAALAPDLRDAAELMVSELATNSIKHANSPFTLVIEQSPAMISVEVRDTGDGHPTLGSPQPWDPTGRGLRIVDLMSSTWGITESDHRKTVWFTLDTDRSAGGAAVGAAPATQPERGRSSVQSGKVTAARPVGKL